MNEMQKLNDLKCDILSPEPYMIAVTLVINLQETQPSYLLLLNISNSNQN